jgi:hypothetical protein
MTYEVVKGRRCPDTWIAEAINHDGDGEIYTAVFVGQKSKQLADEYAAWKNAATASVVSHS